MAGAVKPAQVADLGGAAALLRAARRDVALQRNLDDHRAAGARDLPEQRLGLEHVLEHVGEHAELARAVGERQRLAVVQLDCLDLGAIARDRDRRRCDLHARQAPAETAATKLAEQGAVAAADVQGAGGREAGGGAQRDHVVGLGDGAERAPARIAVGRRRLLGGVRALVEGEEVGGRRSGWQRVCLGAVFSVQSRSRRSRSS